MKRLAKSMSDSPRLLGALLTLPWLAMGILGYFLMSGSDIVTASLQYGLMKTVIAVIVAWVADRSLFWHSRPIEHTVNGNYLPEIRRAIIFLAVCLLLQLA